MSDVATPIERENLYRCASDGLELRAEGPDASTPVMTGHFAVFNQWTEINSLFEGNFLERFQPGAFKKTFKENRESMRVLFQHGFDGTVGDKPLGPIRELREDDVGAYYEVPLLDAGYVRNDILPGLREGLYGASFRFRVLREEIVEEPQVSEENPKGLPERTVIEAKVPEFGPVTFPAYAGASADVRSLSDEMIALRFNRDPERLERLLENVSQGDTKVSVTIDNPIAEEETSPTRAADVAPETDPTDSGEEELPAPPEDSAETKSHSDDGRRANPEPLFGSKPQTPNWRL